MLYLKLIRPPLLTTVVIIKRGIDSNKLISHCKVSVQGMVGMYVLDKKQHKRKMRSGKATSAVSACAVCQQKTLVAAAPTQILWAWHHCWENFFTHVTCGGRSHTCGRDTSAPKACVASLSEEWLDLTFQVCVSYIYGDLLVRTDTRNIEVQ